MSAPDGPVAGLGLPAVQSAAGNQPMPPSAADQRMVTIPFSAADKVQRALLAAGRLSSAVDAQAGALTMADTPPVSPLTKQIGEALTAIKGHVSGTAAPERSDLHEFSPEQLSGEFVRELMLERGWQQGVIRVGSAQLEAMARRALHSGVAGLDSVHLIPAGASAGVSPQSWTFASS